MSATDLERQQREQREQLYDKLRQLASDAEKLIGPAAAAGREPRGRTCATYSKKQLRDLKAIEARITKDIEDYKMLLDR